MKTFLPPRTKSIQGKFGEQCEVSDEISLDENGNKYQKLLKYVRHMSDGSKITKTY